ncbi:MAG: aminotransferase class IV [Candidatus Zixiibacteriota bacterium]
MNSPRKAHTVTTINGRLVPRREAKISVFDNSLLYADGLFETFLACDERVMFLDEHLDRLYKGSRVIDLAPPVERDTLAKWMRSTLRAHRSRIKKLRLTVTSGEAAKWVGVAGRPQVILSAASHRLPTEPFRLQLSEFRVDQDSEFRRIKTLSYAIHAAAIKRALQSGYDDALMLNQKGHVSEVTSANIFWRKGPALFTPPLSSGCLEGVTRSVVFSCADALGVKVIERSAPLRTLFEADEVFICSSLKLVIGVSEIGVNQKRIRFADGPVTRRFADWMLQITGI